MHMFARLELLLLFTASKNAKNVFLFLSVGINLFALVNVSQSLCIPRRLTHQTKER